MRKPLKHHQHAPAAAAGWCEALERRMLLSVVGGLRPDASVAAPGGAPAALTATPSAPAPLDIAGLRAAGQVTISGTPGDWSSMFDGSTDTLYRSESINPANVQLTFTAPTTFTAFRLYPSHTWGNPAYRWEVETADTQADLDGRVGSYRQAIGWTNTPSDQWSDVTLPAPVTARIARLTVQRLTGDNYVHINEWVLIGTTPLNVLNLPRGLDEDTHGRTLVAESGAGRVAIFNADGSPGGTIPISAGPTGGTPWDVAADASDNIYAADTANNQVQKFDREGNLLLKFGSAGTAPGQFNLPRGVSVDRAAGAVYVADTFNHRVQRFNSDGSLDASWGSGGVVGTTATVERDHTGFDRPTDVAVNPVSGEVYVADYGNARIEVFTPTGQYVRTYHAVYRPNALAFDSGGNLYIAGEDPNNNYYPYDGRLRLLRAGEQLIGANYTGGLDDIGNYEGGVAVAPDGHIVFSDMLNRRLVKTDANFTVPASDLRVDARGDTVTFRWKTAVPAQGGVRYGTTSNYGSVATDSIVTTDHAVTITGLSPNTRLYYGVSMPDSFNGTLRWSPQDVINTGAPPGQHQFLRLRAACLIYTDVQGGPGYQRMSDADLARSRDRFHEMAEFYWRNSGFRVWIDVNVIEVNRDITTTSLDLFGSMANDLAALGYTAADNFDAVYGSSHLASGNFGGGGAALGRGVGMAQWGGLDTWVAVHEVNHSLDSIYAANEMPNYEFNHGIWAVPNGVGSAFSMNGQIPRNMLPANLTATRAPYDKIMTAPDTDNDGVPDDSVPGLDNPLPITEKTLGTSPTSADTDGDGVSDFAEATALIYHGSNPLSGDSDGDGTPDATDLNPAYRMNDQVGRGSPVIDGTIDPAEGWGLLTDRWGYSNDKLVSDNNLFQDRVTTYAAWDDRYLYLALKGAPSTTEIQLDGDADNWFIGRGNNYKLDLSNGSYSRSLSVNPGLPDLFRMIDDDGQYSEFSDTDPQFTRPYNGRAFYNQPAEGAGFPGRLVTESDLKYQQGGSGNAGVWELAIPWSDATQLRGFAGKLMALNISVSGDVLFETDDAARIRLVNTPNHLPPSGTLGAADVKAPGATSYSFTVTYAGAPAVDVSTLDNNDLLVSGPGNFSAHAVLVGVSPSGNGSPRVATYRITPPGGAWDDADAGVYTVSVLPGQVADTNASFVPAGDLGTFVVLQPPFQGSPAALPGRIQCEDFDLGGEGVAYHDSDTINSGGQYRDTGVDIEAAGDSGGGYDVGWVQGGEWLEYTVNARATGSYNVAFRVASAGGGGTFKLQADGADLTAALSVPNTGGWQSYQTVTARGVRLTAGRHVLRLAMLASGATGYVGNFNWIDFTPVPTVVGRYTFYNDCALDGNNPNAGPEDDRAIAIDKLPLLPGQSATAANSTSYANGTNGVMIDVFGLPGAVTADDFDFRAGNTADPASWPAAPAPSHVLVRPGAGVAGADRIEITWPDGAILNQWLRVTVRANANTGLQAPDVFYFGNLAGDVDGDAAVGFADLLALAQQYSGPPMPAAPADLTQDGRVSFADLLVLAQNYGRQLAPAAAPPLAGGSAAGALFPASLDAPRSRARNHASDLLR